MASFSYFAYGSNMLVERLQARCASARVNGPAVLYGYRMAFCKRGRDGSGKASIIPSEPREQVRGVLFDINRKELPVLDQHEDVPHGYERLVDLPVDHCESGERYYAISYQALPQAMDHSLQPFDWYLELVLAGARQHGLTGDYLARLQQQAAMLDPVSGRLGRLAALEALRLQRQGL